MLKSLKLGRWSMPLEEFAYWSVVLYWKILSGKQIQSCNYAFLFNKWTYKSHFYDSITSIHPSFLISASLTTNVFPINALFSIEFLRQLTFLCRLLTTITERQWTTLSWDFLAIFQSRLQPVGLWWFFVRWIFTS